MSKQWILAGIVCASSVALANGRFPTTRDVAVGGADESVIAAPTTFGLLLSSNGGDDWYWVCEDALGYQGTYDPSFVVAGDGSLWLTTFDGVRYSRDQGCSWPVVGPPFDTLFASTLAIDDGGRLWAATAQANGANGIYRNDAPESDSVFDLVLAAPERSLVSTLKVHGSGEIVFATGFVLPENPMGDPQPIFYRTTDGGDTWKVPTGAGLDLGDEFQTFVMEIDKDDAGVVFVRAMTGENGGNVLYRSLDGGEGFSPVFEVEGTIEVVRSLGAGVVIVGAGVEGLFRSTDGGTNFIRVPTGIELACAAELIGGDVLGCGSNWRPDDAALAVSNDGGLTWESVHQFDELLGPLPCNPGTVQREVCELEVWPGLREQLSGGGPDLDGGGDSGPAPTDGCGCRGGHVAASTAAAVMAVIVVLAGRGRRRRRRPRI